jgi:hypothetical protein
MPRSVFSIFVSSTSQDLSACRTRVTEMIRRMGQADVRMETFGARPNRPLRVCRDEVQGSDALVVIVGHRYGWVPTRRDGGDGRRSITWWEVQWALDKGLPVYAFLLDPMAPWTGMREQDRLLEARTEKSQVAVGTAVQELQRFRTFLGRLTFDTFTSPEDLGGKVATSLHPWLLQQALANARSEYQDRVEPVQLPPSRTRGRTDARFVHEHAHWQEQVHVLSARSRLVDHAPVTIGLIAGRADAEHPCLAGADIAHVDVAVGRTAATADDYTTALATVLVGRGRSEHPVGVSPESRLLVFNVLGSGSETSTGSVLAALEGALVDGCRVICLPLGGFSHSDADAAVFRRAADRGAVIVCPAGNDAGSEPVYPGAYPGCLAMAAVDRENAIAAFSNRGPWVTAAAPGVDVPVALVDGFQKWNGTFFSCAVGAGAAALILRANPTLTPDSVKDLMKNAGVPSTTDGQAGLRVLDVCEAVGRALDVANLRRRRPDEVTRQPRRTTRRAGRVRPMRRR